jgi:hypothetical protein
LPAQNVNTLGEVPDSSWFTNRIGAADMPLAAIVRGPDRYARLDAEQWIIVEGKDTGLQAGFGQSMRLIPSARSISSSSIRGTTRKWRQAPRSSEPRFTTPSDTTWSRATSLSSIRQRSRSILERRSRSLGARDRSRGRDVNQILRGAARKANGRYRASASPFVEGRYLGPFLHYGTRPDDPNDIVPHEHRRELRGNRVFAAWVNHDDSRAGNSLDMLVARNGGSSSSTTCLTSVRFWEAERATRIIHG